MVEPSVPVLSDNPRQNLNEIPKIRKMIQDNWMTLPLRQRAPGVGKVFVRLKMTEG